MTLFKSYCFLLLFVIEINCQCNDTVYEVKYQGESLLAVNGVSKTVELKSGARLLINGVDFD
jgi:hypothetical protein